MKSKELLDSFVAFCQEHPEFRFWQALFAWCGGHTVLVSRWSYEYISRLDATIPDLGIVDTFFCEQRYPLELK